MSKHHLWFVLIAVIAASVLLSPVTEWLDQRSDAMWWRALPWVLLAVFWSFLAFAAWRHHRRRRQSRG